MTPFIYTMLVSPLNVLFCPHHVTHLSLDDKNTNIGYFIPQFHIIIILY